MQGRKIGPPVLLDLFHFTADRALHTNKTFWIDTCNFFKAVLFSLKIKAELPCFQLTKYIFTIFYCRQCDRQCTLRYKYLPTSR